MLRDPVGGGAEEVVAQEVASMPEHDWFTKGMTKEQIQQILDFYKSRYGQ